MKRHNLAFGAATMLLALTAFACEEKINRSTAGGGSGGPGAAGVAQSDAGTEAGPPKVEFQESDFTETERSRDPFRNFASMFAEENNLVPDSQLKVVLEQYSVDELKLIGLVTRIAQPQAMLLDPNGTGHVVTRGNYVGRAERVQGGTSGAEYEIHWRIDRIRPDDIVLIREDPTHPDVPSATRVLPLRPEGTVINAN